MIANVYGKTCSLKSIDYRKLALHLVHIDKKVRMDGRDFLKLLPDNSIPLVFFDPQYRGVLDHLGYGNEGARQKGRAELKQMTEDDIREFVTNINRVLVPEGHLALWIDKYHLLNGFQDWFRGTKLKVVDHIVWHKHRLGMGYRSRRVSEHLVILQKEPLRAKGRWAIHNIPDVWLEKIDMSFPHAKPIGLQQQIIKAVTQKGDVVVDPAAGGYSVLVAAKMTGRHFAGCDLS